MWHLAIRRFLASCLLFYCWASWWECGGFLQFYRWVCPCRFGRVPVLASGFWDACPCDCHRPKSWSWWFAANWQYQTLIYWIGSWTPATCTGYCGSTAAPNSIGLYCRPSNTPTAAVAYCNRSDTCFQESFIGFSGSWFAVAVFHWTSSSPPGWFCHPYSRLKCPNTRSSATTCPNSPHFWTPRSSGSWLLSCPLMQMRPRSYRSYYLCFSGFRTTEYAVRVWHSARLYWTAIPKSSFNARLWPGSFVPKSRRSAGWSVLKSKLFLPWYLSKCNPPPISCSS